ncbi:MFS general substrate transporter [Martensiomyces pterosporus]|nr:MFS general substrate transporter [Martensiomyces pterosporus]
MLVPQKEAGKFPSTNSLGSLESTGSCIREHADPVFSSKRDSRDSEFAAIEGKYQTDSWHSWLIVLAGCIQAMITLGASRSHGVYQEYYINSEFPTTSTATISWIGSLQNTMLNLCGVAVGILSQVYDTRILCAVASLSMGLAFILASFSTQVWQLVLTQGVMYGAAASFPYILGVTVPMQWVKKRRGLALAIVYMGSGLGGMWISVLTRACIDSVGRQWSNRILGCIMVALGVGLSPLIMSRCPAKRPERILDFSVARESKFLLLAGASFLAMGPNTVPYLLMPTYVTDVLKEDSKMGSSMVTIINVSGIFGRLIAGVLSDCFGPVNMLAIWVFLVAFSQLGLWLPFNSVRALIASAVLFGVTGSSVIGMILNALSHLYGVARITYISGLVYMTYSIASLVVVQTTSLMLDTVGHGTDYTWPVVYTGSLLVVSVAVLLVLRFRLSTRLLDAI